MGYYVILLIFSIGLSFTLVQAGKYLFPKSATEANMPMIIFNSEWYHSMPRSLVDPVMSVVS